MPTKPLSAGRAGASTGTAPRASIAGCASALRGSAPPHAAALASAPAESAPSTRRARAARRVGVPFVVVRGIVRSEVNASVRARRAVAPQLRGGALGGAQHAQQVLAGELPQVGVL